MSLFRLGDFVLSTGQRSPWKIDCDWLTDGDLDCIAHLIAELIPVFGYVEGVPRGGIRLAQRLTKYCEAGVDRLLIVDDVFTTGASIERHRAGRDAYGAVIFARGECPAWVVPLFELTHVSRITI